MGTIPSNRLLGFVFLETFLALDFPALRWDVSLVVGLKASCNASIITLG
jgi:hypothetical protein